MPYPMRPTPLKYCRHCGKQLERKRYNGTMEDLGAFNQRKFCDAKCMGAAKINPNASVRVIRARARKYRRDVCQKCGATVGLQIHHLDLNPTNNAVLNLMTLCASCHTKWHWEHGKKPSKRQSVCLHCDQPARRWDMCQKHYQRFVKYGSPYLTKIRHGLQYVLVDESPGHLGQENHNSVLSRRAPSRQATARPNAPQS